jgi:UDP-N-acetylmuramoyl-L-alanine---L-glutamate ligase
MYLEKLLSLPKSHKIAIIGLGQENIQFLEWLLDVIKIDAAQILIADKNKIDTVNPTLKDFEINTQNIFSGDNYMDILKEPNLHMVFKTPGIWSLMSEFEVFRSKNGQDSIQNSMVFFYEKYRDQIISITGTKGKSTTSSLLNHLLQNSGKVTSYYCGNTTNISPYQFWTNPVQEVNPNEYFVVEVSSFQLQDLAYAAISSKHGIITNYYVDHQDQHNKPEEYWKAKDTIFSYQKAGEITLITDSVLLKTQTKDRLDNTFTITSELSHEIASLFHTSLAGAHNESNVSQAIFVYLQIIDRGFSIDSHVQLLNTAKQQKKKIQSALDSYKPLSHRQEVVGAFSSQIKVKTKSIQKLLNLTVCFIDDGAATEPDAVIAAIKTLTAKANQYIWLFIAGKDKGGDLTSVAHSILDTQLANGLYKINYTGEVGQHLLSNIYKLLGAELTPDRETFHEAIENNLSSKIKIVSDFEQWIGDQITQLEEIGSYDTIKEILANDLELNITLSPCGSSFDEFSSYKERCLWFQKQVKNLLVT